MNTREQIIDYIDNEFEKTPFMDRYDIVNRSSGIYIECGNNTNTEKIKEKIEKVLKHFPDYKFKYIERTHSYYIYQVSNIQIPSSPKEMDKPNVGLMKEMLEKLTGKKVILKESEKES